MTLLVEEGHMTYILKGLKKNSQHSLAGLICTSFEYQQDSQLNLKVFRCMVTTTQAISP